MASPLLATVIDRLENDEYDVKKEAAWVLANILHGFAADNAAANGQRAVQLVSLGCIKGMVHMLEVNDPANGGSFYLQSKVHRAHEALVAEIQAAKAAEAAAEAKSSEKGPPPNP